MTSDEYNKQFIGAIEKMDHEQMMQELKALSETKYWIAIIKYFQMRRAVATGGICTMDPVKDPTAIARTQGALSGLSDLEEMVYRLNNPVESEEES